MKLQVEQAKEHIGKKFPFTYTLPAHELGDVDAFPWSHHDITISGEYWFDGQRIHVQGQIEREGDYECSRCLAPTTHRDTIPFEDVYLEVDDASDSEEEEALTFTEDTVELTELIRETVIINEPYQVLCQEDCKGLCVHCGTNLNTSPCTCDSFVVDPRLAVLRTLLTDDTEKG